MPAFYTHLYFAKQAYNKLPKNIKNKVDYDYYLLFSQSFDILFYNFGLTKKSKEIRFLGHSAHTKNTRDFFINTIKQIKKTDEENDTTSLYLSFLYGSLTHYILDATFHPYIFFKTGIYNKNNTKTFKYNGLHTKYEVLIDKYFYDKEHETEFHKARLYRLFDSTKNAPIKLLYFMNKIYKTTFNMDNVGFSFFGSLRMWRVATKYFKRDTLGIKKKIYLFIDKINRNKKKNLQYYSYYIKENPITVLNKKHHKWFNPADNSLTYTHSIDDLMDISIAKYVDIVKRVNTTFNKNRSTDSISKYIKNISYYSGLNLKSNKKIKFFYDNY